MIDNLVKSNRIMGAVAIATLVLVVIMFCKQRKYCANNTNSTTNTTAA